MPFTLAKYNKIVRNFAALKISTPVYLRAAETAYLSQFGGSDLPKEKIIESLSIVVVISNQFLSEMKCISDQLMENEIVDDRELRMTIAELIEFKNSVQMTLSLLRKRPTQSIVFTNLLGDNEFIFNFNLT